MPSDDLHLSIGLPIAYTQAYVLDERMQLLPVGVPGELYIGGIGLARGYVHAPELTAATFLPHPFSTEPGALLYRTGDLARYRDDGRLEFLGRRDRQLKIRGYRIEPREIEMALEQHDAIQKSLVVDYASPEGEKSIVAYAVPMPGVALTVHELRAFLQAQLPRYKVPEHVVLLEKFPVLPGGKIDVQRLPAPERQSHTRETRYFAPQTQLQHNIAEIWKSVLHVEQVGLYDNFFDRGGNSIRLMQVHSQLVRQLGKNIPMIELFRYTTVRSLAEYLCEERKDKDQNEIDRETLDKKDDGAASTEIAVIGMSGRFPRAADIDAFWQNLQAGVECITAFSDEELIVAGIPPTILQAPNYVKAGAIIDDIEMFDASFFGYAPKEAIFIDPQQRHFLECAWEALEHAAYDPLRYSGRIGVYAGTSGSSYMLHYLSKHPNLLSNAEGYQAVFGNDKDHLSTRVAYKFNLRGPAVTVQTACSTSLVATVLACQALLARQCDIALAGGVSLNVPHKTGYWYSEGGTHSPDGHCRAFDAQAEGTVGGNGVGIVVLKRLAEALVDGDHIHAVIKGFAINNDGAQKVGYTAPSIEGQASVIREALAMARVAPDTLSYIETHGTGTRLGDPIEIAALTQAFRTFTEQKHFCAIGSVKTNIGHLDVASGVVGLIKTVLSLEHGAIPPSLHFHEPNPVIDFAQSPFYVNTSLRAWQPGAIPRRAGISSFGIGGTNAHMIVEEVPARSRSEAEKVPQILVLSAKTRTALERITTNLLTYLRQHLEVELADVAFTLQIGRSEFNHKCMLVCDNVADAVSALEEKASSRVCTSFQVQKQRPVVMLFPGQGTQHVLMGASLYHHESVFRQHLDHCAELLKPHLNLDIRALLYPQSTEIEGAHERLKQTNLAQPVLFALEYALAQTWMSKGVQPQALVGHSVGEYVAACLAGVFTLEDALALIVLRGRFIQALPVGAMLSVALSEQELLARIEFPCCLAAMNGPSFSVVSGPIHAIERLEHQLHQQGIQCRRLITSHAFHSSMMEPILPAFVECVRKVKLNAPRIPYLSNCTGTWISAEEATDPDYWGRHLRQTVRFAENLQTLGKQQDLILLEVGPGQTLSTFARQYTSYGWTVIPSLPSPTEAQQDMQYFLRAMGNVWLAGNAIRWQQPGQKRLRLALPTYPFERERFWIDTDPETFSLNKHNVTNQYNGVPSTEALLPQHDRPALGNEYVAPRNEIEERVALLWQELLGITNIGVHDNFFELGGHSLLATQLLSRVQECFSIDVTLHDVFEATTVEQLGAIVEDKLIDRLENLSEEEVEELL